MKKYLYLSLIFAAFSVLAISCNDDDEGMKPGNPQMTVKSSLTSAFFGDSLPFTVNVSDAAGIPLSTLKAFLYFGDDVVSEVVIRTKTYGDYSDKIYVPYHANIPNATASLKFVLQNIHFTISEQEISLPLSRPDYSSLTLVTESGTQYAMARTSLYNYAATATFPQKVKAVIKAPKYGDNGNEITFGWDANTTSVKEYSTAEIPFSNSNAGNYSITFNTYTYEAAPFVKLTVNGTEMTMVDDNNYRLSLSLTQGQTITVGGIADIGDWWIDPAFISKNQDGTFSFVPMAGLYRMTANFAYKYFRFDVMSDANTLATLKDDGSGAIWIYGESVGKPSFAVNNIGWSGNATKVLCFAPMGNGRHVMILKAGTQIPANMNIKCFYQPTWGGEFGNNAAGTTGTISSTSPFVTVGATNGNIQAGTSPLIVGKTYEFAIQLTPKTVTGTQHAAVLTVTQLD